MKQLTDLDIANMLGTDFVPDNASDKSVRRAMHLSTKITHAHTVHAHITIDFHTHTAPQTWDMVMAAAQ